MPEVNRIFPEKEYKLKTCHTSLDRERNRHRDADFTAFLPPPSCSEYNITLFGRKFTHILIYMSICRSIKFKLNTAVSTIGKEKLEKNNYSYCFNSELT